MSFFLRYAHARLLSPDPGAGGAPPGPGEMPAAWEEKITEMVGRIVNGAISSRDKQADKKRDADKAEFKKMLEESLQGIKAPPSDDGNSGGGGGNKKDKDKDNVELATLKKQLAEQVARSDLFERRAAEERTSRRAADLQKTVLDQLAAYGIEGMRAKAAFATIRDRVRHQDDDSDEIVMNGDDGVAMDLPIALRSWAKTEEAKIFIPSSGSRGSGSRPGGQSPQGQNGKPSRDQQVSILSDLIDRNL